MFLLNRLSIQSKLIVLLLIVSLGSILVVSFIGYTSARDAMRQQVQHQLQGQRVAKTNLVRALLENMRDQVIALADSRIAIEGMRDFRAAYRALPAADVDAASQEKLREFYEKDFVPALARNFEAQPPLENYLPRSTASRYLQYHYIVANPYPFGQRQALESAGNGSAYDDAHRKYHPALAKIAGVFGFEDIVLVDADTLDIVYSYRKTAHFGTNLENGPYADTNLGATVRAVRKARDRESFKLADFEPYRPSRGEPMAFAASPVFDGMKMTGILVFQFPIEEITRIMSGDFGWEQEGLGQTGEVYLVGSDFTLRSRSRFMVQNREAFLARLRDSGIAERTVRQIEAQGDVLLALSDRSPATERAVRGKEGIATVHDYRDEPVLSAYGPLELDSLRWAVIAKMDLAEAYEPIVALGRTVLTSAAGLSLLVSLLALVLSHLIARPIRALTNAARQVTAGANDVRVEVDTHDELRELAGAFNEMTRSLKAKTDQLEQKVRENEELLLNILPAPVAARVREGTDQLTDRFADVTVLFADLVGFEAVSEEVGADASLALLQDLVVAFDEAAENIGVEKVKTVGSSYLAVCGLSVQRPDHSNRMIEFARDLVRIVRRFNRERGTSLAIEIGINAGPVVGGIVGRTKFIYDLWGDTVTIARGLKTDGATSIRVTDTVYERVRDLYSLVLFGDIEIHGKGRVQAWTLDA